MEDSDEVVLWIYYGDNYFRCSFTKSCSEGCTVFMVVEGEGDTIFVKMKKAELDSVGEAATNVFVGSQLSLTKKTLRRRIASHFPLKRTHLPVKREHQGKVVLETGLEDSDEVVLMVLLWG